MSVLKSSRRNSNVLNICGTNGRGFLPETSQHIAALMTGYSMRRKLVPHVICYQAVLSKCVNRVWSENFCFSVSKDFTAVLFHTSCFERVAEALLIMACNGAKWFAIIGTYLW